ncbi:MAG: T9SS type A sorting domain-containing protein, partial [Bacteroidota bacterium]
IINNDNLTDIRALEKLTIIEGNLFIADNLKLSDCCPIANLIDGDINTGYVINNITINNNRFPCRFPAQINEECANDPTLSCEQVVIDRQTSQLTISGIGVPNPIVKLFDKDYQLIFECVGECDETLTFDVLNPTEIYYLDIQFYDRNWESLCNFTETVEVPAEDRTKALQSADFTIAPNPAQTEVQIDLSGLMGEQVNLTLLNQYGQIMVEKAIERVTNSSEKLDVSQLNNGLYILQMQAKGKRMVGKKLLVNRLY